MCSIAVYISSAVLLYLLRFRINLLIEAFPKNPLGDFAFLFSDEVSKNHKIKSFRRSNGYLVGKKQFKIFEKILKKNFL